MHEWYEPSLPSGYAPVRVIDVKNKRTALLLNFAALGVMVLFGVLGVIIGMYLFGYGAKCLRNLVYGDREHVYKPVEKDAMILYSIMFPLLFQWTARGNFSGNFYMTVFACLPFIIKKALL